MHKEFYFVPLRRKYKLDIDGSLSINRQGVIVIGEKAMIKIGIDIEKGAWIQMFEDSNNRAVGLQVVPEKMQSVKDGSVRYALPTAVRSTRVVKIGITNFIKTIPEPKLPTGSLEIKEFEDKKDSQMSGYGRIYYVVIPRIKKEEKTNEET